MGAAVLRYFSETCARLAALGDPKYGGAWVFDRPLSVELQRALVMQDVEQAQPLLVEEGRKVSSDAQEVLYSSVDLLFPCAVQNVLTEGNVDRVRARYVCEGANGPVSEGAREALYARNVPLVPDFIANCGGVVAAFVELTSNSANKVEEAKSLTRQKIADNVRAMFSLAERYRAQPQHAALHMALGKIRKSS
jgi:glutamate dehydrogenase (NAD(P)+)